MDYCRIKWNTCKVFLELTVRMFCPGSAWNSEFFRMHMRARMFCNVEFYNSIEYSIPPNPSDWAKVAVINPRKRLSIIFQDINIESFDPGMK